MSIFTLGRTCYLEATLFIVPWDVIIYIRSYAKFTLSAWNITYRLCIIWTLPAIFALSLVRANTVPTIFTSKCAYCAHVFNDIVVSVCNIHEM